MLSGNTIHLSSNDKQLSLTVQRVHLLGFWNTNRPSEIRSSSMSTDRSYVSIIMQRGVQNFLTKVHVIRSVVLSVLITLVVNLLKFNKLFS